MSELGSKATGLPVGTPVVGGGGDQPAGAVGNGIVRQGVVSATMGTSGVVFAHADTLGFDPLGRLQRGCHAVPGAWHVMGVVLAAGGSFQWFRNELGKAEVEMARKKGEDPYFLLTDEAALAGPGAEGLFFLPYLTGERTPHFDPDAKGAWVGLTVRHGRAHMIRSLLEGATFAMRDSLELIREMGVAIEQVRLSGGGARNALWKQIQADIYGCDVHTLNSTEGPAFGVALLAQVGTGGFRSVPEACDATIRPVELDACRPQGQGVLRSRFPRLSPALSGPARVVQDDQLTGCLRCGAVKCVALWDRPCRCRFLCRPRKGRAFSLSRDPQDSFPMQASDADDMPSVSSNVAVTAKANDPPVATVGSAGRWALTMVAGFVAGRGRLARRRGLPRLDQAATPRGEFQGSRLEYHRSSRSRQCRRQERGPGVRDSGRSAGDGIGIWPVVSLAGRGAPPPRRHSSAWWLGAAGAPACRWLCCRLITTTRHNTRMRPRGT